MDSTENLISWIKAQPNECTVYEIKKILNEKMNLHVEGLKNSESMNMEGYWKELSDKNERLSVSLSKIEEELNLKIKSLEILKEKLEKSQIEVSEKEAALLEEKTVNEVLMNKISELRAGDTLKVPRKIIELENEIENKGFEVVILTTENIKLQNTLEQYKNSNTIYLNTIDELKKKLHSLRLESCDDFKNDFEKEESFSEDLTSLENLESFSDIDKVNTSTQTPEIYDQENLKTENKEIWENKSLKDGQYVFYISCMAKAVEDLLTKK